MKLPDKVIDLISSAIQIQVEREFDNLKKKLFEDLEEKKNYICTGVLLQAMKSIDISSSVDRITIVIKEIKEPYHD